MDGPEPLTTTSDRRMVAALAIPALGTLAADPVLSLIDTAFVGRIGSESLAALGVDAAIFGFAFALFNFLAYATTPLVAQARGRGDIQEAGQVVRRALLLAVVIGIASTSLVFFAASRLVMLMGAGAEIVGPATAYLEIRAFALPAVLIVMAANGAYRGFKDTRTPLYVTLLINVVNVVLDPVLIFGLDIGLEGAAIATVIAQWAGAIVFLRLLTNRSRGESWSRERIKIRELRSFLGIGSTLIVRTGLLVLSLTLATSVAARSGTFEVAAHQVVSQLWFLLAMVIDALAIAAQSLVADSIGRGDVPSARRLSDMLLRWGVGLGMALAIGLWASGGLIARVFTDDIRVGDLIVSVIPVAALMQPLAAVLFVLDGVFLAMLAVRKLVASTAAGFVATVAVLGVTLARGWGLDGVWWAITAMVIARLAVLMRYYAGSSTWSSS